MRWVLVMPVKHASRGKSRLGGALSDDDRAALARAMALDTVETAVATAGVDQVIVVSADEVVTTVLRRVDRVWLLPEPAVVAGRDRLNAAVDVGIVEARRRWPAAGVAVLLADLPLLVPVELEAALRAAARHERSLVVDWQGTGTTLLAARPGAELTPAFGAGSAAAHEAAGHLRLDIAVGSGLRRDVDLPGDLARLRGAVLGARTGAAMEAAHPRS